MLRAGSCVGWLGLALLFGGVGWGIGWLRGWGAFGVFSVWIGVGVFLKACLLVWARTTMKATAKCEKRCELHGSVNHQKFERILFFRVILEIMFLSVIVCVCVIVSVCWCVL